MLGIVGWFLGSALFTDFIGYWLHRWAHRKGSPLFRAHMTHHLTNYPPKAVLTPKYHTSGSDSLVIWFAPFLVAYLVIMYIVPAVNFWPAALGAMMVALLSSLIHDATHVSGSFVWRRKSFLGAAVRHHAHHFKMRRNYGILIPTWDVIFKTRKR